VDTKTNSTYRLSISGMSCQHCVAAVKKSVAELSGVSRVCVDLQAGSAEITGGNPNEVISAITQAGYEAVLLEGQTETQTQETLSNQRQHQMAPKSLLGAYQLAVDDMSCASCVAAVERAICSVPGVETASVNLVEKRAQVIGGDPNAVVRAVTDHGYGARLVEAPSSSDSVQLEFNQRDFAQTQQSELLSAMFIRCDKQAEYRYEDPYWRITTSMHPADLLIELKRAGHPARLVETVSDPYAEEAAAVAAEVRRSWQRALLAGALGIGLMVAEITGLTTDLQAPGGQSYWLAVAIITLFVMRFSGGHYYLGAIKQLKHLSANMDSLIALGTGTAWLSSLVIVMQPDGGLLRGDKLYFDASVLILAFLQFGHVLEIRAKRTTSEAVGSLVGLAPKVASLERGGALVSMPVSLLRLGDLIRVKPGERIAIDGEVVDGQSSVDEALLTGESLPVRKQIGDQLIGGSINRNGSLLYRVTRLGEETTLAHIVSMVRQAQMSKPAIGRLADKVSAIFVPVVVMIALITFMAWLILGPQPSLSYGLTAGIAVLVIACPCALGLATPIAIMVGTTRAAQMNVLIRNSEGLQSASGLTHLVVDKTGTLTQGAPQITAVYSEGMADSELLALAASVEAVSSHPLADAIISHAKKQTIKISPVSDFCSHEGLGVEGLVDGRQVQLGGAQYLSRLGITPPIALQHQAEQEAKQAGSLVWVLVEGCLSGLLVLKDPLRHDSLGAIKRLHNQGVEVVMCTGDNAWTAQAVADQLGVAVVYSELLPAQKLDVVRALQKQGYRVGMVGDGVNDAPALAQADTGFAIGSGTDVAIQHADITLVGDSLYSVNTAIAISRATLRNIKQNLFGAFIYNMIGIPMAAGLLYSFTGWLLPPMFASAAMAMSSVTVVANANRLRFFKPCKETLLTTTLKITGMTCSHCVNNVAKALQALPGVEDVQVDLDTGRAVVTGPVDQAILVEAVVKAGYSAESVA
jgi:P-type Cu+ transporter